MSPTGSVTQWLSELRLGSNEAAEAAIWDRYFQRLAALARQRLRAGSARAADEEDVVLTALDSFFRGARQGRFPLLSDRTSLWPLLVKITARKACNQLKHERAARRGGGRVRGESVWVDPADRDYGGIHDIVDEQPTPQFAAEVTESCRRLLDALADASLREIAGMKLAGYTNSEIANELAVVERTVERKLERIRRIWARDEAP